MKKLIVVVLSLALLLSMFSSKVQSNENTSSQHLFSFNKSNSDFMDTLLSINSTRQKTAIEGTQLVCFQTISFSNLITTQPKSYYEDLLTTGNNSLENYYNKNAHGKLTCKTNGMFDDMKLPEKWEKYYLENKYLNPLFDDIEKGFKDNNFDISPYDQNNDGLPDILFVLSPAITFNESSEGYFFKINRIYQVRGNILVLYFGKGKLGGGVIDLPEIFDLLNQILGIQSLYNWGEGIEEYIGLWDITAFGSIKGVIGLSSFTKYKAGWIDEPKIISKPGEYEVDALGGDSPNKSYKIPIPGSEKEFLLIENRQKIGSDAMLKGIPSEGLIIYHLDESVPCDFFFNSPSLRDRKYPGLQVLDRSQTGNRIWFDDYLLKHGANFSEESRRTSIDATMYCTPFVNPFLRESRIIHVLYQFHSCNFSQ